MVLVPTVNETVLAKCIICQTSTKNNLSEGGESGFKRLIDAATERKSFDDAKSADKIERVLSNQTSENKSELAAFLSEEISKERCGSV